MTFIPKDIRENEKEEFEYHNLMQTLADMLQSLNTIAAMANSGQPALRVIPIITTPVSGTVTATVANATIASNGGVPAYILSVAQTNLAAQSNINNVIP
jgi:hypothetical protein